MAFREASKELTQMAIEELNEDPKRTQSDIDAIQLWIKQQPHLADVQINEQLILIFLRGAKFSLQTCKERLDIFLSFKNILPEFLLNKYPYDERIQYILKLGMVLPLLEVEHATAPRVIVFRFGDFDTSKYNLIETFRVGSMISDIMLQEDDHYAISGQQILLDLKGTSIDLISQITPSVAKMLSAVGNKIFPIRQKGVHLINLPRSFEVGYNLIKTLLSKKLQSRVNVHNLDMDSLYQHISKKILPKEYGGDGNTIQELTDHWKTKVESYQEHYMENEKYKSNEKLRPEKMKINDETFGLSGSFRQLNFD